MSGFPVNVYRFVAEERVDGVVGVFNEAQSQGVVHSVEQSISQVKQGPVWLAR